MVKRGVNNPHKLVVRLVNSRKHGAYFRLEKMDEDNDYRVFKPGKTMRNEMRHYRPPAPQNPQLLQSIRQGNVKQQNIYMWIDEALSFIAATVDAIVTAAALNDPYNKYVSGDGEDEDVDQYHNEDIRDRAPIGMTDVHTKNIAHLGEQ